MASADAGGSDALEEGVLRVIRALDEAAGSSPRGLQLAHIDVEFAAAPAPLWPAPYDI